MIKEVLHMSKQNNPEELNEASLYKLRDALLSMPRAKVSSGGKEISVAKIKREAN